MLPRDNHRSKLTGTPLARAPSIWISTKSRLLIYGLFLAGIAFLIHHNILLKHGEQQFAYLAQSFLTGISIS
jgi:hypothetical protein